MDLELIIKTYQSLELDKVIDHEKFSEYALTHHSTSIEGSTLTETDTRLLLDEGITPKGKPLEHSLMVKDHHEALQFVLENARSKKTITVPLIQSIAGKVLKNTGRVYNTVLGNIDSSKGEFRKGNVHAGQSYFVSFDKVEKLTNQLVIELQADLSNISSTLEKIELANRAHFDLVTIHPFYDGNGRTSRLLMNYIQAYFNLPLGRVFKEDRAEYFEALTATRKAEDITIFQTFMKEQYKKQLNQEIQAFKEMSKQETLLPKKSNKPGRGRSLFF